MKTEIIISGQINGNFKLASSLSGYGLVERKNGMFNSIIMIYSAKKYAVKSLSGAYQSLIRDEPDQKGKLSGIRYNRGHVLYYDASKAIIN